MTTLLRSTICLCLLFFPVIILKAQVPQGPTNLTAEAIDNSKVKLTWKDNSNDETTFVVERSDNSNTSYVPIDTLNAYYSSSVTFTDITLTDSSKYYYRVRAKNNVGYSSYSNEVAVTTFALHPPKVPENLRCDYYNGSYRLLWDDNSTNETSFLIERSDDDNKHFVKVDSVSANLTVGYSGSLYDSAVYYFRVRAKNNSGYSAYSDEVVLYTNAIRPKNLKAIPNSVNAIDLYWDDQSYNRTSFIVERSENDNLHFQRIDSVAVRNYYLGSTLRYTDRSVKTNINYYYRIASIIKGSRVYCVNEDSAVPAETGGWISSTGYPGTDYGEVGFNYNDSIYMGLGSSGKFYCYNKITDKWKEKSNINGKPYDKPSFMVVNNKGLACLGTYDSNKRQNIWIYDFEADSWTQKSNFPFADRNNQISFAIDNVGYILGGKELNSASAELKDFYKYDINTDTWTKLADFPGGTCSSIPVFVYNKKAYIVYKGDQLWEYTPGTDTWAYIRVLSQALQGTRGLNINEHFYILGNDLFEYDFINNKVIKRSTLPSYTVSLKDDETLFFLGGGYNRNFYVYKPFLPTAPSVLTSKPLTFTKVQLNWNDGTNLETKYLIERSEGHVYNQSPYVLIDSVNSNSTSYLDSSVVKGKSYFYRIRAKGEKNYSNYSNKAFCKTNVPNTSNFDYISTSYNSNWVVVRFSETDFYDEYYDGIIVERSEDNLTFTLVDTIHHGALSIKDTSLTMGKTYYYRAKVFNSLGSSDYTTAKSIPGSLLHGHYKNVEIGNAYYLDEKGFNVYYGCYNSIQTILPKITGDRLIVNFKTFSLPPKDTMIIYDGMDENSPILVRFYNGNIPVTKLCSSNSKGALTFKIIGYCGAGSGEGWLAYVKSTAFPPATNLLAKKGTGVILTWKDNSDLETNFVIERSESDTTHFSNLTSPAANAVTYTDTIASLSKIYYYRIKAVYSSGSSEYSNIAVSDGTILDVPQVLKNSDITLFPNPASSSCTLRMNLSKSQNATISLANITGMVLNSKNISLQNGLNEIPVNIDGLPSGTYFVIIKNKTDSVTKILTISR